jgi:glycosyltransferase involved in cell wall biosynthesis
MERLDCVYVTNISDSLGIVVRLDVIKFLAQNFELTVYTNQPLLIKGKIPFCNTVEINKRGNFLYDNYLMQLKIAKTINKSNSSSVFTFEETASFIKLVNKPSFVYTIQFGKRTETKNVLKKLILGVNQYFRFMGLKQANCNFVVSHFIIRLLKEKGLRNLVHMPHGVHIFGYQQPKIVSFHNQFLKLKNKECFIVTYTGWVCENRGFALMLESLDALVRSNDKIVLVIAGADEEFARKINEFTAKNKLDDHILNLGKVDASLIPGILHYSDICLSFLDPNVPAYRISPPQKVVEYFAAGKPVICNKIETHDWLVKNGENGFIVDYSVDQVVKAILQLHEDRLLLDKMSKNALIEASNHDFNKIYGAMIDAIKSRIDESKK